MESPVKKKGARGKCKSSWTRINKTSVSNYLEDKEEKQQQTRICREYTVSKKTNSFQAWVAEFTGEMEAVGVMPPDFILWSLVQWFNTDARDIRTRKNSYNVNTKPVGAWEQLLLVHSPRLKNMSYGGTQVPALDPVLFNVLFNDLDDGEWCY